MDQRLKAKIEVLRKDHENASGKAFNYFWCPILFIDEDTDLCIAHIVNQAFPNSDNSERAWTVQRKDVDNFYGAMFEADFVAIKYKEMPITGNVIVNKELFQQLNPKILLDGKDVDFFVAKDKVPSKYSLLTVEGDEETVDVGIKIPPADFQKAIEGKWEIDVSKDVRLQALVSLIKAAHLTLFELFGYHYALSAAGRFVGHDILGTFFLQNKNEKKKTILGNASKFFAEFVHMVRPVQSVGITLQGSITDKTLLMCRNQDGTPWAWIVFVKAADTLHTVLIPISQEAIELNPFLQFLKNGQEIIEVSSCTLTNKGLEVNPQKLPMTWIKTGDFSLS